MTEIPENTTGTTPTDVYPINGGKQMQPMNQNVNAVPAGTARLCQVCGHPADHAYDDVDEPGRPGRARVVWALVQAVFAALVVVVLEHLWTGGAIAGVLDHAREPYLAWMGAGGFAVIIGHALLCLVHDSADTLHQAWRAR